jgi:hypothetical protein
VSSAAHGTGVPGVDLADAALVDQLVERRDVRLLQRSIDAATSSTELDVRSITIFCCGVGAP